MFKRTNGHTWITIAIILVTGALLTGSGHAAQGTSKGTLNEKLKVDDCGSGKDSDNYKQLKLKKGGRWTAKIDGLRYGGTYTQKSQGREFKLTFNKKSKNQFVNEMEDWASDLCGESVDIKKVKININLKLNKKRTELKGTVNANASGRSASGKGTGKYTGKVEGNWKR